MTTATVTSVTAATATTTTTVTTDVRPLTSRSQVRQERVAARLAANQPVAQSKPPRALPPVDSKAIGRHAAPPKPATAMPGTRGGRPVGVMRQGLAPIAPSAGLSRASKLPAIKASPRL